MRYVAAYCLASMSKKTSPTVSDLEQILSSVGIDYDAEMASKVVSELNGKNLAEIMKEGKEKLGSVPSGGGGAAAAAPAADTAAAPAKVEAKKVEEPEEESDDDMGFGLFD